METHTAGQRAQSQTGAHVGSVHLIVQNPQKLKKLKEEH